MRFNTFYDNELIPASAVGELATQNDAGLLAVSSAGAFLPRVQLFGGSSDAVKEGKINVGRYGLVRSKDQLEDLGPEVDVLVCAGRSKALDMSGDNVITSYDHKSEIFQMIANKSTEENSRCMYGPEYLVYVPAVKEFATFFLSSPTARREGAAIHARLRKAATLKAQLITGKKHKWHGPVITANSTPISDIPAIDKLQEQITKFLTTKSSEVEVASESDRAR